MKNKKTYSLSLLHLAGVEPYKPLHNEKYMNNNQLLHFRRILEAWKNKLKNENYFGGGIYFKDKVINYPDPIDRAVQEEEFNFELRTRERELFLIKKIEITLKKVEKKIFGFCDTCGEKIGIRRLEAQPIANLCIDCKTLSEIREKQTNS